MKRLYFTVKLESDTVITQSSGTAGGHACLDYLPGGVFIGALAAQLYESGTCETFTLFHSGRVRCLPAYGWHNGAPVIPAPLSWHTFKAGAIERQPWDEDGHLVEPHALHNLAVEPRQTVGAVSPMRDIEAPYLDREGNAVKPHISVTPKTATHNGVAREAHLFAYQALREGSEFGLCIELDASVGDVDALAAKITAALTARPLGLGRSRSAEFGRACVRPTDQSWQAPPPGTLATGQVLIYCYSDLALLDPDTGQTTLVPQPAHFPGLPKGTTWDATHSFLKTRRYTPFNGKRRRPDPERQVLVKGSVLAFTLPEGADFDPNVFAKGLAGGVGLHREAGLGKVWVQPPFLLAETPNLATMLTLSLPPPGQEPREDSVAPVSPPDPDLYFWLTQQQHQREQEIGAARLAREWASQLIGHIPPAGGVSRSQWGAVRLGAIQASSAADPVGDLFQRFFGHGVSHSDKEDSGDERGLLGGRGVRGQKWERSFANDSPRNCLRALLRIALSPTDGEAADPAVLLRAVQLLAIRMPREMAEKGLGEKG